jgi:hypothetical protein
MSQHGCGMHGPLELDNPPMSGLKLFKQANRVFTRESTRDTRGQHRERPPMAFKVFEFSHSL